MPGARKRAGGLLFRQDTLTDLERIEDIGFESKLPFDHVPSSSDFLTSRKAPLDRQSCSVGRARGCVVVNAASARLSGASDTLYRAAGGRRLFRHARPHDYATCGREA